MLQREFDFFVGKKLDVHQFINATQSDCEKAANINIYRAQHHLPRLYQVDPWNPIGFRKYCAIHKISETQETADYQFTYFGDCKFIYTVEKKTDLILAWRYTEDSRNCVPGP